MKWCGRMHSGEGATHELERVKGLLDMRRPETVEELMQFPQAANWMRPYLPRFAEAKAPLRALMDERLAGMRRTKTAAKRRPLMVDDWTPERTRSWEAARRLLRETAHCPTRSLDGECSCYPTPVTCSGGVVSRRLVRKCTQRADPLGRCDMSRWALLAARSRGRN